MFETNNPFDEKQFHSIKARLVAAGGLAYHDFKKTLRPNYPTIAFDIACGWLMIAACTIAGIYIGNMDSTVLKIVLALADAILLGFVVNYLGNFFHEASHYNIAPSKKWNDRLANTFLGILQAQHIQHYRQVHWQHHIHLGTPEDTEHSYFSALNFSFFFESLTGIRAIRIFLYRSNNPGKKLTEKNGATKAQQAGMLLAGVAFHLTVLALAVYFQQYWLAGIWLLGFGTFFPFFGSLRQLLEHRGEWASQATNYHKTPHGKLSRIFSSGVFAATFGSAGFNRHLLHHLEPQISYTNLKALEHFLSNTSIAPQLQQQKTTYWQAFIKLLGK
ncbi:MAG TPA: fatty acid desaturase [Ferruginibacter sp.]|nr:fatty acid desaturase [Ferruginibacter sp.]HMP20533.1 fatty acid desaturase [Ferruginibacter sp.]